MKTGVLTVSTSRFLEDSPTPDGSGDFLEQALRDAAELKVTEVHRILVEDDIGQIVTALNTFIQSGCHVVVTTGGTGFTVDDVTPEATKRVIEKECPGIVHALLQRSLQATPMAALTRLAAGIAGTTLIVNFPGSVKACRECFEVLRPLLPHAVNLITGSSASKHPKLPVADLSGLGSNSGSGDNVQGSSN